MSSQPNKVFDFIFPSRVQIRLLQQAVVKLSDMLLGINNNILASNKSIKIELNKIKSDLAKRTVHAQGLESKVNQIKQGNEKNKTDRSNS